MDKEEYSNLFTNEKDHWWYQGLRDLVLRSLKQYHKQGGALLDAGCGTGGLLELLQKQDDLISRAIGVDISDFAIEFCKKRKLEEVYQSSIEDLPLEDSEVDSVVSLDVLYHLDVEDDHAALKEFERVLKPGGILIINLPAFESLRGSHDISGQTKKRYTKQDLEELVVATNFDIIKLSYRNVFLFPAIYAYRKIMPGFFSGESKNSDLWRFPKFLNSLLNKIVLIENWLLQFLNFPFGTSVYCIAKKK